MSSATAPSVDGSRAGVSLLRRALKAAWSVASTVAVTVALAACSVLVVVAVTTWTSPRGHLEVFGHPTLVVVSGSMSPAIRTGDLIVDDRINPAQARRLHPGQVVTFRGAGGQMLLTHRIVSVLRSAAGGVAYTTRGDANNAPDVEPISPTQIVGVYRARIPGGGYVLTALHRPAGLALLLAAPALLALSGLLSAAASRLPASHPREEVPAPGTSS